MWWQMIVDFFKIIGLTILAVKSNKLSKCLSPDYVLFDDGKTFIDFKEQDDSYHDCDSSARRITINENAKVWNLLKDLPDSDKNFG